MRTAVCERERKREDLGGVEVRGHSHRCYCPRILNFDEGGGGLREIDEP